ncbi:hypothetical protein DXN05_10245 [Deminuibacter soli]|uniref:Uncharacterized protein n=1 Tax=Deminuibacter soli TaxID=2291815 RepID=A0A3E1NMH7_9BACT|nr:hypothetical protein DXN05_10245 [Deminuibacter soli]
MYSVVNIGKDGWMVGWLNGYFRRRLRREWRIENRKSTVETILAKALTLPAAVSPQPLIVG